MKQKARVAAKPGSESVGAGIDLLSMVAAPRQTHGVAPTVAKLEGFSSTGRPLVRIRGCDDPVEARRTVPLNAAMLGADVLVLHEDEDPRLPIIVGVIDPDPVSEADSAPSRQSADVQIDGERIVFHAAREIVLRCGKSSLTLLQDGRITVRGEELESRAAGRNKIKGAAVHLN